MLKKSAIRRMFTSTLALIIVSILCLFPTNELKTPYHTTFIETTLHPIYIMNQDNYIVRTSLVIESNTPIEKAKELIDALRIGSGKSEYIPNNFKEIIPQNTKVLDISLNEGLLKINFSKDFLNIEKNLEEKLIEALTFTLTEIPEVKQIMIFIEGKKLDYLPQSKINLPTTLDRNFGINKIYDITSMKDASKTTIYYIGKENNITYYVPVTKIDNNKNNKIEIIIEELKSSPIYETNLISYLASSAELESYEALENQINLSFNNQIFEDFNEKNILEEVKYSISLSIKDTMQVSEINFLVNNEIVATFKENE